MPIIKRQLPAPLTRRRSSSPSRPPRRRRRSPSPIYPPAPPTDTEIKGFLIILLICFIAVPILWLCGAFKPGPDPFYTHPLYQRFPNVSLPDHVLEPLITRACRYGKRGDGGVVCLGREAYTFCTRWGTVSTAGGREDEIWWGTTPVGMTCWEGELGVWLEGGVWVEGGQEEEGKLDENVGGEVKEEEKEEENTEA